MPIKFLQNLTRCTLPISRPISTSTANIFTNIRKFPNPRTSPSVSSISFNQFQPIHTSNFAQFSNSSTSKNNNKMAQLLAGQPIVLNDGTTVDAGDYLKDKVVAIYFSAMWCPPCRAFTPKLKKFYEELKEAGKNFEVIFVSRDRSAEDLKEYYNDHHGRWVYIEFGDPKIAELLEKFTVKTIPTCRLIKPDGSVVVQDARTEIQEKGQENALELWDEWMSFYE